MLNISFDGTAYHGWQIQNNALSVCQVMEEAVEKVFKTKSQVIGCSRTDAGVHALNYICNFKSDLMIPEDKVPYALNTKLPHDVRVKWAKYTDDDFHSRYSVHSKTYLYKAICGDIMNPLMHNYAYHFPYKINLENMQMASKYFCGTHDFSGFMAQGSNQNTTVRTVNFLNVSQNAEMVEIEINANAYLYNMVRIISGTLLMVGMGKIPHDEIPDIIASKDRTRAGITAEPQGLYLKDIAY